MRKLKDLYEKIEKLKKEKKLEVSKIGVSVLGNPIYAIFFGNKNKKRIFVEGGIHAREWITCFLVLKMIKNAIKGNFEGYFCFVPVVNPDGVGLALEGESFEITKQKKDFLKKINNNNTDFSLWKANINGVDCNVNFDALWGRGKSNTKKASSQNYIGKKPNSEIEVKNMINLLNRFKPNLSLSYHSKGEVIFYGFEVLSQNSQKRDEEIAQRLCEVTGYQMVKTFKSTGGLSDYVSANFDVPAFTVEVGNDELSHPIKLKHLNRIFKQNQFVLQTALDCLNQLDN